MKPPSLDFVEIESKSPEDYEMLKTPTQPLEFPLTQKIINLIEKMKQKVVEEEGVGLAANQVGHHIQLIIFRVEEYSMQHREDAYEMVPLTTLINPSFSAVEEEGMREDWEGCFSVRDEIGKVPRYNTIRYEGFDVDGKKVEGTARGFLARVLQHEIDHINGYLIIDRATETISKHRD